MKEKPQPRIEWKPSMIEELKNLLIAGENKYDIAKHFHTNHKNLYDVIKRYDLKEFEFKQAFREKRAMIFVDGMVNLNPPHGFNFLLGAADSKSVSSKGYRPDIEIMK